MNKKAFSFVEMIVVISIIILLAVIGATINTNLKTKTLNTRSTSDLSTLENSFLAYLEENKTLPPVSGNKNYFKEDTSYSEPTDNPFGVYGQVTSKTLPGKYLNFLPLDQFTGAFYAYGKMVNVTQFEVAGVIRESGTAKSIVKGNYKAESGPYNLIREYNGPNFVYDGSNDYFPYNPDELSLNARITEFSSGVTGYQVNQVLEVGDNVVVPAGEQLTLYFGDGSKSVLGDSGAQTELTINEMSYPEDGNSLISKVSLALDAGTIWTNATQMGSSSEFSIQTGDTTAAVRGTIFGVSANENIRVVSGIVEKTTLSSPSPVDITSSNSDSVDSINTEIDKGTGDLTSTLKTEVVSYDADTKIVVLKTNNVFKYDAQYLLAGTTEIRNDGSWDTPEHDFDLTSISGDSITLKFCKEAHGEQICTREASIAKELGYIADEVTGGPQTCDSANGFVLNTASNQCELAKCIITGTNAPGGGWYAHGGPNIVTYGEQYSQNSATPIWAYKKEALPSGNGIKTLKADPECRRVDGGEPVYENQELVTLAPDYNDKGVKCNAGYQHTSDGEECEQVLLACDNVTNTTGFTLSVPLDSGNTETGITKTTPLGVGGIAGTLTTTADLQCNNGVLSTANVSQSAACNTGYIQNNPSVYNCDPVQCLASTTPSGWTLATSGSSFDYLTDVNLYKHEYSGPASNGPLYGIIDTKTQAIATCTDTGSFGTARNESLVSGFPKCKTPGYDYTTDDTCIKNNLGGDWKVVKYVDGTITNKLLSDYNLNLGSQFAFEYKIESSDISTTFGNIIPYIKSGGTNILYSESSNFKLGNTNGIISYSSSGISTQQNLTTIFNNNSWSVDGLSMTQNTFSPGTPTTLDGDNINMNKVTNLKIYIK